MKEHTLESFVEVLASKSPTPSGGGACALAGCLAAALGNMVGNLTIGKKKYKQYEEELIVLQTEITELRNQLLDLIQFDADCFEPLSKAYSLDKADPNRATIMEECLKLAASAPYKICQTITKVIDCLEVLEVKGSTMVVSDVATSACLASGALKGAAINVFVNTKLMKDADYATKLNQDVNSLVNTYTTKADSIYTRIYERMI